MSFVSLVLTILLFILLQFVHIFENLHLLGQSFFNAFDVLEITKLIKISQFTHLCQLIKVDVVAIFVLNDIIFGFFQVGPFMLLVLIVWLPIFIFLTRIILIFSKYVIPKNDFFGMIASESGAFLSSLLLSLFSLFIFFLFIGCWLAVIISIEDFLSELDAELALFDPGCFGLKSDIRFFKVECFEDKSLVNTWNHIWWLDKWETKRWFQLDFGSTSSLKLSKTCIDKLEKATKALLLRENV